MEDSVATGRKPVVAGRAVHGSSSSLVGYRRTNEGYCSLLYSTIHTRTGARTSTELLGWLQPSPLFDWLPLHPCPPSFCSRGTERKRGGLVSSPTVARIPFPFVKQRPFCSSEQWRASSAVILQNHRVETLYICCTRGNTLLRGWSGRELWN